MLEKGSEINVSLLLALSGSSLQRKVVAQDSEHCSKVPAFHTAAQLALSPSPPRPLFCSEGST